MAHKREYPHYYVCFSEKIIYHSKPNFDNQESREKMFKLGLSSEENYINHIKIKSLKKYLSAKDLANLKIEIETNTVSKVNPNTMQKEKFVPITLPIAKALAKQVKRDTFFPICAVYAYTIIDCPQLSQYQNELDLKGKFYDKFKTK